LLDTPAPDRCDDLELGKVRSDRIDDSRLLANEQLSGAMQAQAARLFGRLSRHEAHGWLGDSLANRFCVSSIVLLSFDIRLDIGGAASSGRRDRAREVHATNDATMHRPRYQQAWWQLLEERQDISSLELTSNNHIAFASTLFRNSLKSVTVITFEELLMKDGSPESLSRRGC
jgi:hypothetical protein